VPVAGVDRALWAVPGNADWDRVANDQDVFAAEDDPSLTMGYLVTAGRRGDTGIPPIVNTLGIDIDQTIYGSPRQAHPISVSANASQGYAFMGWVRRAPGAPLGGDVFDLPTTEGLVRVEFHSSASSILYRFSDVLEYNDRLYAWIERTQSELMVVARNDNNAPGALGTVIVNAPALQGSAPVNSVLINSSPGTIDAGGSAITRGVGLFPTTYRSGEALPLNAPYRANGQQYVLVIAMVQTNARGLRTAQLTNWSTNTGVSHAAVPAENFNTLEAFMAMRASHNIGGVLMNGDEIVRIRTSADADVDFITQINLGRFPHNEPVIVYCESTHRILRVNRTNPTRIEVLGELDQMRRVFVRDTDDRIYAQFAPL
jgi:hypothetical protein